MAWLREIGIIEANPVTLSQLSWMWIDSYVMINDILKKWQSSSMNSKTQPIGRESEAPPALQI